MFLLCYLLRAADWFIDTVGGAPQPGESARQTDDDDSGKLGVYIENLCGHPPDQFWNCLCRGPGRGGSDVVMKGQLVIPLGHDGPSEGLQCPVWL